MPKGEKTKLLWKDPQYRKHMSEVHKGIVTWSKGKKMSLKSREKMRKAKIGFIPWNKGKTGVFSKETHEKWSKVRTGKIMSEETKKKRNGN